MILPVRKETIVLSESKSDIRDKINYVTGIKKTGSSFDRPVKFVGKVGKDSFSITRYITRPENFMPLIQGRIEDTNTGSILFLRYTLQFSSRMFVLFWTITTLLFAVFLWYIQTNYKLGIVALAVLVFNIAFTHFSFQRQYKVSRKQLMEVLGFDHN